MNIRYKSSSILPCATDYTIFQRFIYIYIYKQKYIPVIFKFDFVTLVFRNGILNIGNRCIRLNATYIVPNIYFTTV